MVSWKFTPVGGEQRCCWPLCFSVRCSKDGCSWDIEDSGQLGSSTSWFLSPSNFIINLKSRWTRSISKAIGQARPFAYSSTSAGWYASAGDHNSWCRWFLSDQAEQQRYWFSQLDASSSWEFWRKGTLLLPTPGYCDITVSLDQIDTAWTLSSVIGYSIAYRQTRLALHQKATPDH